MSKQKTSSNVLPIAVMFMLFAMISFVTGFQNPMGVIVKNQFEASNFLSQLGNAANFIAYAFMGVPAGLLLKRKGYKVTALSAVTIGLIGVAITFLSGRLESFGVYLTGAFISGFSMCMLNVVVNPMLNTLGGEGKRGNQLIQFGGSLNSISATLVPVIAGYLIGGKAAEEMSIKDANPLLFVAMGIFAFAFLVLAIVKIPEPHIEKKVANKPKDKYSPMSFRHFVLGAVAIFIYVGVEVGIPNIANLYMTTPTDPVNTAAVKALEKEYKITPEDAEKIVANLNAGTFAANVLTETPVPAVNEETINNEEFGVTEDTQAYNAIQVPADPEKGVILPVNTNLAAVKALAEETIAEAKIEATRPGLGIPTADAGTVVGTYWFLMFIGRLLGGLFGGKVSSRAMLSFMSALAILFVGLAMILPTSMSINMPVIQNQDGLSFGLTQIPVSIMFLVLCGLSTSIMWGSIFNLAVEGLGKYTAAASGIFMMLVCGGGILPLIQGFVADKAGFLASYWVIIIGAAYMIFYAIFGSKNVNKEIPVK